MPDQSQPAMPSRKPRRGSHVLSTALFVAAIAFGAAAVAIWYYDDSRSETADIPPTSETGVYGLINVLIAMQDADLDADYGRSPATVSSNQLDQPGQNLNVEGANVFIFLYPGADAESATALREQEAANLDPATMTLSTPSGLDAIDGKPLTVVQGSNVVAVLVGGDPELQDAVRDAIEGLT